LKASDICILVVAVNVPNEGAGYCLKMFKPVFSRTKDQKTYLVSLMRLRISKFDRENLNYPSAPTSVNIHSQVKVAEESQMWVYDRNPLRTALGAMLPSHIWKDEC
jgi:hypothetical protein